MRWHCTVTRSGSSPSTEIRSASSRPGIRRRLQDDQPATGDGPDEGDPELASYLRIEEREFEAGGLSPGQARAGHAVPALLR